MINKINKCLARLTKHGEGEKRQINKIRNKIGSITADPPEIKRIIRE